MIAHPFRPTAPVALYVHVPFCTSKCDYCSFFSLPGCSDATIDAVVRKTVEQAHAFLFAAGSPPVSTVYLGGGTPSVLAPRTLRDLGEGLMRAAGQTRFEEWTVEANPATVTDVWLDALCELPVTRVSLGVQSFSDRALRALGRRGRAEDAVSAMARLCERGQHGVGVDLIAGRPRTLPPGSGGGRPAERDPGDDQTVHDVETALSLGAEHVSLYALTIDPQTPLATRIERGEYAAPPDASVVADIEAAQRVLERAGVGRYEVSNYARPGKVCRHNDAYWRLEPSVGVGPGAVSTLPAPDGTALRMEVSRDVDRFIGKQSAGPPEDIRLVAREIIPRESFLLEHFIMGLRRTAGIPSDVFRSRFGAAPGEVAPRAIERWVWADMARLDGERLSLTEAGLWFLDSFLGEIARELRELTLRRA